MAIEPQFRLADGTALRMYREPSQNNYVSEQRGRPVFDECIFVEVLTPGAQGAMPVFEILRWLTSSQDDGREPVEVRGFRYDDFKQYLDQFLNGEKTAGMGGTPLSEWPEISQSLAATLQAARIYTVDALASLPDTALLLVGPDGRTWRDKAAAYLARAANNADFTALASENARLADDLADKDRQLKELADKVQALTDQMALGQQAPQPVQQHVAADPAPQIVAEDTVVQTPTTDNAVPSRSAARTQKPTAPII